MAEATAAAIIGVVVAAEAMGVSAVGNLLATIGDVEEEAKLKRWW